MINKKRLISTFIELVKIDSPSGYESEVREFCSRKFKSLGGDVATDSYGNLIARFEGAGQPYLINSHMDTVEPGRNIKPKINEDMITSDGTTILGADAKAGVAIILESLTSLVEQKTSTRPIEVLLTVEEEIGLKGAVNLDYAKIKSKTGLTFDATGDVGRIVTTAPGYSEIDVRITGRGAHAGFEPEKGISAIQIAAEIISQLQLGRIDEETTANIGLIEGGTARNAVPETAHFKAEIRSRSLEKLEKQTLHFQEIFAQILSKYKDIKIDTDIKSLFDPYIFRQSHELIGKIKSALKKIGVKPRLVPSGGGADVNIFKTHGIDAVCVGAGYYNPHTTREYARISEMIEGVKLCEELITI